MTLDRVLSRAGLASRTEAAAWIAAGRVAVDGKPVREPQTWVEPGRQKVSLDGRAVRRPRQVYLALHKPVGTITSHGDPEGRPTIYDLLPARDGWLFSVGRLDQDTSGLLLVTNDSDFAERIASPEGKVAKLYRMQVRPPLRDPQLDRLRAGLAIGRGEHTAPAHVEWLRANGKTCWIEMEIREGKNRQVRRMIEALGHEVVRLQRTRIGKLELTDLPPGRVRRIQPSDVL